MQNWISNSYLANKQEVDFLAIIAILALGLVVFPLVVTLKAIKDRKAPGQS